jgi:hypothetical protein
LRCTAHEAELREFFVDMAQVTVERLGSDPSESDVNRAVAELVELFRAFEDAPRKSVQGLWAEVLAITVATDPATLIRAWHSAPDEAFDFADGATRLEVKSFGGVARAHTFSLRQVHPGAGIVVVFVSVRAERSAGGATIRDLIARVSERGIAPSLALKVHRVVARTLGTSAATALSVGFDFQRAVDSLRFFASSAIPSVDPQLPAGVLSVRFEALLDEERALSPGALRGVGDLVAAAQPLSPA